VLLKSFIEPSSTQNRQRATAQSTNCTKTRTLKLRIIETKTPPKSLEVTKAKRQNWRKGHLIWR
jgi:hypothetical protein